MSSKARRNQKALRKSFIDFAYHTNNEEVFFLRFRKLLEEGIYSFLKSDFIQGQVGPNLKRCFKRKPDFSKKNSLKKALSIANAHLHFKKHKGQSNHINKGLLIHSLGAFLIEFNKVELSQELQDLDFTQNTEEETKPVSGIKLDFEKNKTIDGYWRVVVESKGEYGLEVSVLDPEDIEGHFRFVIDEWKGQFSQNSPENLYSNTSLQETFDIIEVGDVCTAHFMHVRDDRVIAPSHLVLHPDYLISASSISESATFVSDSRLAAKDFLFNQFEIPDNHFYFFRGNVINTLFDTFFFENDDQIACGLRKSWKEMPLDFYRFADKSVEHSVDVVLNEVNEVYKHGLVKAEDEIQTLTSYSKDLEIFEETEPSFIQPAYGLSGRLDYLKASFRNSEPVSLDIVELKSGRFYKTARPGHLNQLAYYDLLLRNVEPREGQRRILGLRKILYPSAAFSSNTVLHGFEKKDGTVDHSFIPFRRTQGLINGRNIIVQMLHKLSRAKTLDEFKSLFLGYLRLDETIGLRPYDVNKFVKLKERVETLSQIEYSYFLSLLHFGLRDNLTQAIGEKGSGNNYGASGLWRANEISFDSVNRVENLSVKLESIVKQRFQKIIFLRSDSVTSHDNFKVGNSIQIREQGSKNLLTWMCIPGTIESISFDEIVVRLRTEQKDENSRFIDSNRKWIIEDLYINNLKRVFSGVKYFLDLPSEKRHICIGMKPPSIPKGFNDELDIKDLAILAKDYFIVNGVPGSGKSSRIIKSLVKHYASQEKRVLLLTYTHKAADRLCEVLSETEVHDLPISFIRSTTMNKADNRWKGLCVDHLAGEGTKADRKRLREALVNHSVRVGSILSFKVDDAWSTLFEYDCVIVDEASQVLESDIIHIVGNSKKFVLVGDVNQLPAITSVTSEEGLIPSSLQSSLGIKSFSSSYFERMYYSAMRKGWTHAFGNLTTQGRMHEKIMNLANALFYQNEMDVADPSIQCAPIKTVNSPLNEIETHLAKQNLLFFNCPSEANNSKSNSDEADLVVDIIKGLVRLNSPISKTDFIKSYIGVVTPFRAQKALVSNLLQQKLSISNDDLPLIDTVESFQGSQRKYIIYTTAVGIEEQLQNISSISEESGVDRKLDVVITRAEEQLIVVGNKDVLQNAEQYKTLIEFMEKDNCMIQLD